jgi:hypothetical protein
MTWEMQNSACLGGDQQACRIRDAELLVIESQGWCLTATKKWQPAPCKLAAVETAPSSNRILEIKDKLPASLQKDWADFAMRFENADPMTLTEDGWLVGKGCMVNSCDRDAAAWAINTKIHEVSAIIENDRKFFIYGSAKDIPTPLAAWGVANGMTESNMVRVAK